MLVTRKSLSTTVMTKSAMNEVNVVIVNDKEDDPGDKKLLHKLDWHLLPTMTLLYLLSFLDRVNIGQAKLGGLTVSLKLNSTQYNACLTREPFQLSNRFLDETHWVLGYRLW